MMRHVAALLQVADAATFGVKISNIQYYFSPDVLLQEFFCLEPYPSRPGMALPTSGSQVILPQLMA
jgi:hypothetical protein